MGIDIRSGAVAPSGGGYAANQTKNNPNDDGDARDQVYRSPAAAGIDKVEYIPYGNVYERMASGESDVAEGGVFDRPPAFEATPIADVFIEGPLYPPYWEDDLSYDSIPLSGFMFPHVDSMDVDGEITGGTLRPLLLTYDMVDETISVSNEAVSGTLLTLLLSYDMVDETISVANHAISGSLVTSLITYSNYEDETIRVVNSEITSGTLI